MTFASSGSRILTIESPKYPFSAPVFLQNFLPRLKSSFRPLITSSSERGVPAPDCTTETIHTRCEKCQCSNKIMNLIFIMHMLTDPNIQILIMSGNFWEQCRSNKKVLRFVIFIFSLFPQPAGSFRPIFQEPLHHREFLRIILHIRFSY